MSGFSKNWQRNQNGRSGGLGSLLRNPPPVKPQIDKANREISLLIARLGQAEVRIKSRDETIFRKVVSSMQRGDKDHASMYANELSEVRKIGTTVSSAKLALEQVSMRLTTVTDIGELAATLAPTIAVVRGVGQGLGNVLPNAQGEINEISSLLSTTLVEAGSVGGSSLNFEAANEDAERVLAEATAVASQRMDEEFPRVPVAVKSDEKEEGLAA